jgi:hypothetical protein
MTAAVHTFGRVTLICADCGDVFYAPAADSWKTVCRFCWKGEAKASKRVLQLEAELAIMRRSGNVIIDAKRWRQLLHLCHPDRHGGSAAANDVAQWLNQIRAQVGA